jgi:hypothetical protein
VVEIIAAAVAGAIIGALAVTLPDLVTDLLRVRRLRRAERAVVRAAEDLLRRGLVEP